MRRRRTRSAAALLIPGSGKTDRDSDVRLPLHQMLRGGITRQVSDALIGARVSTLRYDKRGVGASEGDYLSIGMAQRLTDARAALGWLAAEAAGLPLLAVGHSEGTYYAAQLAAEGDVAGAVLLSGSARTGAEVLAWQTEQMADRLPRSARVILRLMRTDAIRAQRKNMDRILASSDDVIRIQGTRVNARWVRDFAAYDPGPVLARITVPVLAITGGADVQVPPGRHRRDWPPCRRTFRWPCGRGTQPHAPARSRFDRTSGLPKRDAPAGEPGGTRSDHRLGHEQLGRTGSAERRANRRRL